MTDTITTDPPTDLVPLAFPVAVVDHVSPEHLPAWAVVTRMPEPAGVTGEHSVIHIRHDDDLPLDGIVAIAAERARQVIHARFTPAWDHVHHPDGSLARMARDILDDYLQDGDGDDTLELRRTRLAHAGAFIAAELDRLTDLEVNG